MASADMKIQLKPVNKPTDKVILQLGDDAEVIVPASTVVRWLLDNVLQKASTPNARTNKTTPRIGERWPGQGGIYAGVMRGRDGAPDYHLLVGDAVETLKPLPWDKAMAAAKDMEGDGHKDYTLPFRAEQALQFANVPELFESEWYWSCEQHAAYSGCAWVQGFGGGSQGYGHKSYDYRARAVRRLVIR